jgi:ABC-type transporter Mla subunit MlaD
MPAKTHGERLDRLDQIVEILAERQADLEKIVADLATETRRGFDQVAVKFGETDERFRDTDKRFRETNERFRETAAQTRQTNERADKMVFAIGELIRAQHPPR